MSYATQEQIKFAESLGYKHEKSARMGSSFSKKQRHVWSIFDGWQTADIVDDRYTNHEKFNRLEAALTRPMPELTTEQKTELGEAWAQILMLKKSREHKGRYLTTWGNKTALGIYEVISRLTTFSSIEELPQ